MAHLETVSLKDMIQRVVDAAHEDLIALREQLPDEPLGRRSELMGQYLAVQRMRFVRLAALLRWVDSGSAAASQRCRELLEPHLRSQQALAQTTDQVMQLRFETRSVKVRQLALPARLPRPPQTCRPPSQPRAATADRRARSPARHRPTTFPRRSKCCAVEGCG